MIRYRPLLLVLLAAPALATTPADLAAIEQAAAQFAAAAGSSVEIGTRIGN